MCHAHCLATNFNPLNAELNLTCHWLALLGGATIVVVSKLRFKADNEITPTYFHTELKSYVK